MQQIWTKLKSSVIYIPSQKTRNHHKMSGLHKNWRYDGEKSKSGGLPLRTRSLFWPTWCKFSGKWQLKGQHLCSKKWNVHKKMVLDEVWLHNSLRYRMGGDYLLITSKSSFDISLMSVHILLCTKHFCACKQNIWSTVLSTETDVDTSDWHSVCKLNIGYPGCFSNDHIFDHNISKKNQPLSSNLLHILMKTKFCRNLNPCLLICCPFSWKWSLRNKHCKHTHNISFCESERGFTPKFVQKHTCQCFVLVQSSGFLMLTSYRAAACSCVLRFVGQRQNLTWRPHVACRR